MRGPKAAKTVAKDDKRRERVHTRPAEPAASLSEPEASPGSDGRFGIGSRVVATEGHRGTELAGPLRGSVGGFFIGGLKCPSCGVSGTTIYSVYFNSVRSGRVEKRGSGEAGELEAGELGGAMG